MIQIVSNSIRLEKLKASKEIVIEKFLTLMKKLTEVTHQKTNPNNSRIGLPCLKHNSRPSTSLLTLILQ